MKILLLTVLSHIVAIENIVVDSGQSLTITCIYTGIYIDINKEVLDNGQSRPHLLFLRVGENAPDNISSPTRPWLFNQSNSYYGSNATENKLAITLAEVEFDDEGTYFCKNVMKQVTASFKVTVVAPPKSKVTFKTNLSVKDQADGISVGKCEATGAKPAVQIYWEDVEGNRVESAEMKSITRGKTTDAISQLRIGKIDKNIHHQQKYRCVVYQNDTVVFTSQYSSNINVEWEPERMEIVTEGTLSNNDTAYDEGTEVTLMCTAEGNPNPVFEWSIFGEKENRTLDELDHWSRDNINLNSATLTTKSLRATDSAITFVCSAKNVHGEQSYQVKLDIKELPAANAGPMGLLWALLGVIAVVLAVAVCMLMNRWIQRRRSGIYKTETNHRDGSCDSLNDELQAAAKKEYFM